MANEPLVQVTEAELLSLGFRPSGVDVDAETEDKSFGWKIYDKHGSNDSEPQTHVLATFENGKCSMWLETYDEAGHTIALIELPRKFWTFKHVKALVYVLSGAK